MDKDKGNKSEHLYIFIYYIRKYIPRSSLFYSVYLIMNFIPVFIITHNLKEQTTEDPGVDNILLLTIFGVGMANKLPFFYLNLTYALFAILLFFIGCVLMVNRQLKAFCIMNNKISAKKTFQSQLQSQSQSQSQSSYQTSILSIPSKIKHCIQMVTYATIVIALLFPYLIELNSFGLYCLFIAKGNYMKMLILKKEIYIFVIVNIIFIILTEIIMILFLNLANSPFPHMVYGNPNFDKKRLFNVIILCSSLQGVYTLLNQHFNNVVFKLIMNSIVFALQVASAIQLFFSYNYYRRNFSLRLNIFFIYWGIIAALLEILLFSFYNEEMSKVNLLSKLIVEIIASYVLTKASIYYINNRYINLFFTNVSMDKKSISISEIIAYTVLLSDYDTEHDALNDIGDIIYTHKEQCNYSKCPCQSISLTNYSLIKRHHYHHNRDKDKDKGKYNNVNGNQDDKKKGTLNHSELTKQMIYNFIISLGEYSLMKSINNLYKQKSDAGLLELLIICHIDYIFGIRKINNLAFYYSIQYTKQRSQQLSFMTKYYLYEYRQQFFQLFTIQKSKANQTIPFGKPMNSHRIDTNIKATEFYSYVLNITKMIELMKLLCIQIDKVLSFRKTFSLQSLNLTASYAKCESFIKLACDLRKFDQKIVNMITNESKEPIDSYELSYLLNHYFLITRKKIPKNVKAKIKDLRYIVVLKENDDQFNSFERYNMVNPLILSIDAKDDIIINYISMRLCNALNYNKEEIINANFNMLIPQEIGHYHQIMMKKFFLFSSSLSYNKGSFIQDKNNYILPVQLSGVSFPTIDNNFNFILDIQLPKESSSHKINKYYFILNTSFKIITANEKFKDDFFLSLKMLNQIKVSFGLFFGLNEEKLKREVSSKSMMMNNKYKSNNNIEDENNRITIFSSCKDLSTTLDNYHNMVKFDQSRCSEVIIEKISIKSDMKKRLQDLSKMIEDFGLDIEWYNRISALKERLSLPNVSNSFNVQFKFKSIGDIQYSIVTVSEQVIHSKDFYASLNLIKDSLSNLQLNALYKTNINEQSTSPSIFSLTKQQTNKGIDAESSFSSKLNPKTNNSISSLILEKKDCSLSSTLNLLKSSNSSTSITINQLNNNNSNTNNNITGNAFINNNNKVINLLISTKKNITGGKRLITIRNNSVIERNLRIGYQILCILMIILSSALIIINDQIISLSKNIFDINTYSVLIKSGVYFIAMSIFVCCDYASMNDQLSLDDQRWRLEYRGNEIINHYTSLTQSLNALVSESQLNPVFTILSNIDEYSIMMSNFKIKTRQSIMSEEIFYLHYTLLQLKDESMFVTCRIKEIFYYNNFESLDETTPPPNLEEVSVYYVFANTITTFKDNLQLLTEKTHQVLTSYHIYCKNTLIIYNSILLFLEICLALVLVYLLFILRSNSQFILRRLYIRNIMDDVLENKITQFKVVLDNFTIANCEKFERVSQESYHNQFSNGIIKGKKRTRSLLKLRHSQMNNLGQLVRDRDRERDRKKNKGDNRENKGRDRKSINNNKDNENDTDSETNKSPLKLQYITPTIMNIGIIITVVLTVLFCALELTNIFIYNAIYDELLFANIISLNFLDRIPKMCEILLYFRISVLTNDAYYITTPQKDYDSLIFTNYYKAALQIENNSIFISLGDSEFSFIYYQSYLIKKNTEIFTFDPKHFDVLPQTLFWERQFNINEGLCIYSSLGFEQINSSGTSLVKAFTQVNQNTVKCKGYTGGLSKTTLAQIHDFTFRQLTNVFTDFVQSDPETRDLEEFLGNKIFRDIDQITEDTLKRIHNIILSSILFDMLNLYERSTNISIIFSVSLIVLSLLIFIIVHCGIMKRIDTIISILIYVEKYINKATLVKQSDIEFKP